MITCIILFVLFIVALFIVLGTILVGTIFADFMLELDIGSELAKKINNMRHRND